MKYAVLAYEGDGNLGDEIQSLATEQHLPHVDARVDRETLATVQLDEPHVLILNGWFAHSPELSFPPSASIVPIFLGFHVADTRRAEEHILSGAALEYLKRHEAIGCRDEATQSRLKAAGVDAYVSNCLTLTYPAREEAPAGGGDIFIVDGDRIPVPRRIALRARRITHVTQGIFGAELKRAMAQRLIDVYRDCASLIITTRLHCALPCLALGIPVVFFGEPNDARFSSLTDLGLVIHALPRDNTMRRIVRQTRGLHRVWAWWASRKIDWNPKPINIEKQRAELNDRIRFELANAIKTPG
jgi:hypothetical protein